MKESSFWNKLKTGLKKASSNEIFLQRHEDKILFGLPDVHYLYNKFSGWIELKSALETKNRVIKIKISQQQKIWAYTYHKYGGNVFLFVLLNKRIYIMCPDTILQLEENMKIEAFENLTFYISEENIDYNDILHILCS